MEKPVITIIGILISQVVLLSATIDLELENPPAEMVPVIEVLESDVPVRAHFQEYRSNPFQKRRRRFEGEIFWHPDHGLSLQYSSPGTTKINVTRQHVSIYRNGMEHRRMEVSQDDPSLAIFYNLFAWDKDWFAKNFSASAELNDCEWELTLRPKDQPDAISLNSIRLSGSGKVMSGIRLDLSGGKLINIELSDQEIPWEADDEILKHQFQTGDELE